MDSINRIEKALNKYVLTQPREEQTISTPSTVHGDAVIRAARSSHLAGVETTTYTRRVYDETGNPVIEKHTVALGERGGNYISRRKLVDAWERQFYEICDTQCIPSNISAKAVSRIKEIAPCLKMKFRMLREIETSDVGGIGYHN